MGAIASDVSSDDDSTDTPASDSSSEDSPSSPTNHAEETIANGHNDESTRNLDEVSDSDDVSMSADSDDETSSSSKQFAVQNRLAETNSDEFAAPPSPADLVNPKKRRLSSSTTSSSLQLQNAVHNQVRKRLKAEGSITPELVPVRAGNINRSLLPAEIWHHIFTFCPPTVLGSLLCVNKSFNTYLGSSFDTSIPLLSKSALKLLSADDIWRASRKRFLVGAPGPLLKHSELQMWQLACGRFCQFCGRQNQIFENSAKDQWHPGPGENGVAAVWVFGMRTCGLCLKERSSKEIDLLLSSTVPSPLMAALPFIFLSNELHVIPPTTLQAGQHPPSVEIAKHFSNQQVEDIKKEFEGVKLLGSAAVEEWLKGLDGLGKERRTDAARWERWEASGGLLKMREGALREAFTKVDSLTSTPAKHMDLPSTNGVLPIQGPNLTLPPNQFPFHGQSRPAQTQTNFLPSHLPPRFDSPIQPGLSQFLPRHNQPKQERTKEQVAELKAARRAEIERQCMLLDPPLTAGVLAHMTSFQAAIQIIQPLSDGAWEVLKPRLLSQREDAERREKDRLIQIRPVQDRSDGAAQDQSRGDSKDLVDREWEDIQAPLRIRIGGYADEIIRDGWNAGDKVNFENAPLFAAEVLIYVRKRFYAEVAKDEAALRATGREPELDPPNGPFTKKLILENMKWIFDSKIKPITELHRKELFLCNDCDFHTKYYGFEGIIQHYAAKHTNALSIGTIVVHWKSEWPQHPPFNPDPNNVKPGHILGPNANGHFASAPPPNMQQGYGYGGYQPTPVQVSTQNPPPPVYQQSPGPYFGHPQFDPYASHQNGPYAPPQYPVASQSYQPVQYTSAPQHLGNGFEAPADYSQQSLGASYAVPSVVGYSTPGPSQVYPLPSYGPPSQSGYATQSTQQYGQPPQPTTYPATGFEANAPQVTELYRVQLQQLARDARDIWNSIFGVKEVPGSVKVYTVIYHLLSRFRTTFQEDPPLSMLVDGLNNNKDMRPVRNVNGLVCKACSVGMPGSTSAPNKKHFSFPQLVNHFHSIHEEEIVRSSTSPVPDWTKDMVELPDLPKLQTIPSARGMDDQKLKLFVEALPEIFAPPPASLAASYQDSDQQYYLPDSGPNHMDLAPSQDNHEKYYAVTDNAKPSETTSLLNDAEEYDPRNPRDIIVESRPFRKSSLNYRQSRDYGPYVEGRPVYKESRPDEQHRQVSYYEHPDRILLDERPMSSSSRPRYAQEHGRPITREAPLYIERPAHYRDSGESEHQVRRERPTNSYEERGPVLESRDHRAENSYAFQSNRQNAPLLSTYEPRLQPDRIDVTEESIPQQTRIYEVVAQIQQQAKVAQEQQHARQEPLEGGSEDGEVGAEVTQPGRRIEVENGHRDAERFLDEFRPGEPSVQSGVKAEEAEPRREISRRWEAECEPDNQAPPRRVLYDDSEPVFSNGRIITREEYPQHIHERVPSRQSRAHHPENRHITSHPDQPPPRERSPELVDRRYKLNNVIYRDERQSSARRTPSRYARYESVRLENDRERVRSGSPVYVKTVMQPSQYRERSPVQHEPVYRARSPLPTAGGGDHQVYERVPMRQEVYRVYADEPQPRLTQREARYEEAFEYVRVSDPQGDYMIRRPVRRQVEQVYAPRYEDESYVRERQPVYEVRPRQEPQQYEEEYDPRHPEPLVSPSVQRARYQ